MLKFQISGRLKHFQLRLKELIEYIEEYKEDYAFYNIKEPDFITKEKEQFYGTRYYISTLYDFLDISVLWDIACLRYGVLLECAHGRESYGWVNPNEREECLEFLRGFVDDGFDTLIDKLNNQGC